MKHSLYRFAEIDGELYVVEYDAIQLHDEPVDLDEAKYTIDIVSAEEAAKNPIQTQLFANLRYGAQLTIASAEVDRQYFGTAGHLSYEEAHAAMENEIYGRGGSWVTSLNWTP